MRPTSLGSSRLRALGQIALLLVLIGSFSRPLASAEPPDSDRFQSRVKPFLEIYCIDCHGRSHAEAGIVLDGFADQAAAVGDDTVWFRVLEAIQSRVMPPADIPQPEADEIAEVVDWVEQDFLHALRQRQPGSARPVIRRLNRQEYQNTIRDLLGVDLPLAEDLPQDEISFGYDNVGAALSLSPLHIEKYLDAAERVVQAAIVLPDARDVPPQELIGLQPYDLSSVAVKLERPLVAGRYLADLTLSTGRRDGRPPSLAVSLGSHRRIVEAATVHDDSIVYRVWLTAADDHAQLQVAIVDPSDAAAKEKGAPAERPQRRAGGPEREWPLESVVVRGPIREAPNPPPPHRQIFVCQPQSTAESTKDCAQQIIAGFASRAFRRPVAADELAGLIDMFALADRRGESFERAVQVALTSVLVSPRFLYLAEIGDDDKDRPLTDYELASRLSYFLWSSIPDDELRALAAEGELRGNLTEQVHRMLADPKAAAFVENFAGQWLQLRKLEGVTPDQQLYPEFDEALRGAMREETERTFAHVLRNDRSVLQLLDADYLIINERLARHYGIDGVRGEHFRMVPVEPQQRGGLLTQASVLTLTSNPNRTSPVKRGQWILEQLLATPPPPPPPAVDRLDDSPKAIAGASLRDRLEAHRANAECAACHDRIDPLGFAFEHYDAIGRWRETDGEFAIDPSGKLTDGRQFADARQFKALLRADPKKFSRSLIENMLIYALGRGLEPYDRYTVETIRRRLVEADYRSTSLILGIVESEAFQRTGVTR